MVKENEKEPEKDLTNEVHADKKIGMDDVPELCCQGNRRMEKVFTENDRQDAKERNGSGRKEKKACSGQQDNVQDGRTQAKVNIGDNILEMRTENATIRNDDHNLYGTVNRNMVQGLMDIALLSANANQLRFLLVYNQRSSTYYISLTLVIISLCLQVIVGVLAIFQRRTHYCRGKHFNESIICGVFIVSVVNVLLAAFTTVTDTTNST